MKSDLISRLYSSSSDFAASHLGQHSFLLKMGDKLLAFDPFLTPLSRRLLPPPVPAGSLEKMSLIFGSHDHADHIDRPSLAAMAEASESAVFIFPKAVKGGFDGVPEERIIRMDAGETVTVDGVKISALASAHELLEYDENGSCLCLGFVVEYAGKTVYHSGDCCIYEGLAGSLKKWHFDLMMLPVNGRDAARLRRGCLGNMSYQEAVELAGMLRPELVFPGHYDMFAGNTADPADFLEYLSVKFPGVKGELPPFGSVREL
jgi:L-ascorbate metabolism protein UlaG (beta-lactamase superfamily)